MRIQETCIPIISFINNHLRNIDQYLNFACLFVKYLIANVFRVHSSDLLTSVIYVQFKLNEFK